MISPIGVLRSSGPCQAIVRILLLLRGLIETVLVGICRRVFVWGVGCRLGVVPISPKWNTCRVGCHNLNHLLSGGSFVVECGIILYFNTESIPYNYYSAGFSWDCAIAHLAAFINFPLSLSAMPVIWGWWGILVVCVVPILLRNILTDRPIYSLALSVCSCSVFLPW